MSKLSNRMMSLVMAGSLVGLAGCMGLPTGVNTTSPLNGSSGSLDLGLAGSGYTVSTVAQNGGEQGTGGETKLTYTFSSVMFKPELIEVHYAGELTEEEKAAAPQDIKGDAKEQTQPSDDPAGEWIQFPVAADFAAIDLAKLSSGTETISFGSTPLKPGRYDQIRLSAKSTESQAALTYVGTDSNNAEQKGNYFLPSGRLYITQGFEVREGYKTNLKFNFDVQSSIFSAGGQKVILKPGSVKVFADYEKVVEASPSTETTETTETAAQ